MKRYFLFALLNVFLIGCASEPPVQPPPPPTIVNLQIDAADNLNADSNGNGAPVMLRIYELRELSSFNGADFFALFNNDQGTLGADVTRRQDFLLKPGESKKLTIKPDEDVISLGFFAAFRQLDTAQWRVVAEVLPNQTQDYLVKLIDNQLTVEAVKPTPAAEEKP